MVPKLDLTAGALATKRVSGVAGVRDDVVLSVLFFWNMERLLGWLITWWLW